MVERLPATLAALCLTVYWAWVVVKLVQLGRKLGKDPNAMPRERVGQLMRLLWYPCILVLLVGLWGTATTTPMSLWNISLNTTSPHYFGRHALAFAWLWQPGAPCWWIAVIPASVICLSGTLFTFVCWRKMGRSWRIGIDPNEKLALVCTGPYRYVRHPIYALRMAINVAATIMAPTPLVVATAIIDILLLQIEARREERYMEAQHGEEYAKYKISVGRFIPRPFVV